jgi:glycosyltransferase involved in cell wall biosynthesis
MRLTILNQFYPPDLAPTGQLAASLAIHRAGLGDQVTVVTGRGSYVPESQRDQAPSAAGLRITRLWTPSLGKRTLAARLIDYAWFHLAALIRMLFLPRQDVIICLTTPPFIAWAAALHRWLHPATRLILWNMDCYPEALFRAGLIPEDGRIAGLLRWQNRLLFRQLSHVICLDVAMAQLLSSQYIRDSRALPTTVIPNWEPAERFAAADMTQPWVLGERLASESRLCVLHVGNTGYGHSFETIVEASEQLREDPVAFVFVGGGERWSWLEAARRERALAHWHLVPYLPEGQFRAAMASVGCALITLRDSFLGIISPSKLHAALAMSLPVLYVGPEGSNVDEAIRRFDCGVSLRHGNAEGVVDFVRRLRSDADYAGGLRRRAREAFERGFSDQQALPAFDRVIEGLAD